MTLPPTRALLVIAVALVVVGCGTATPTDELAVQTADDATPAVEADETPAAEDVAPASEATPAEQADQAPASVGPPTTSGGAAQAAAADQGDGGQDPAPADGDSDDGQTSTTASSPASTTTSTSTAPTPSSTATTAAPTTEAPPAGPVLADISVTDLASGNAISLARTIPGDARPALLWFWAPH